MAKPKKSIGRPRKKPGDGQRNHLGLRVTAELKLRLEKEAVRIGRSLSQEVEFRLERSFLDDEARLAEIHNKFGGSYNYAIALAMARIADQLSGQVFAPWTENEWIFHQVREAFDTFLDGIAPPAGADKTGGRFVSPIPENQISGKELAEYWLVFLQSIGKMDDETKAQKGLYHAAHNVRRVAFDVEPEIAPLIGRKESENE